MSGLVTALYDCRSKQEYIYRTNKIKEIAGGSALLAHVYEMFYEKCSENGIAIETDWKNKTFSKNEFESSDNDGIVIYEGGGNLYIMYKSRDIYLKANRLFSKMLLDKTYTINVIACCVDSSENFNDDRRDLYIANTRQKNMGTFTVPCNVLPFTQLDRNTWQPVAEKEKEKEKEKDLSRESVLKLEAYKKYCKKDDEINSEILDSLVLEKGKESLLAVIYIDGNAMGKKIKALTENIKDYDECVKRLRDFSKETNRIYVDEPLAAINKLLKKKRTDEKIPPEKNMHKYRKVVGGGDEITIICNARDAKDIVLEYFSSLKENSTAEDNHASCAGIAIFHSHDPFSEIYRIAEACCESGKKETRKNDSRDNYIDFHFCHSGIVNELEVIREKQEKKHTARPYKLEDFEDFCEKAGILSETGRQNIKTLRDSIFAGDSYFEYEVQRILSNAQKHGGFKKLNDEYSGSDEKRREFQNLIYDISLVYDLWFEKREEDVQKNKD